ncbi:MAG: FAD-binding oxidoreductase [Jatrophihabitantaceae bacterium]
MKSSNGTTAFPSTTIVGAGIIGTLTAREILSRLPRASVTVIERDTVGSGASRRSAGLHFPRGGTERVRRMSDFSAQFYQSLQQEVPALPIYPLPETSVIGDPSRAAELRTSYLGQANISSIGRLPNEDVQPPSGAGLWRIDGCHQADVYGVTQALACRLRGQVSFREGLQVTGIEQSGSGVLVRLGTGELIRTDRLVLAPGPWLAAPAWRELVAPLGLRVKKIVALHVEQVPGPHDRAVVFQDEDAFLIPVLNRGHWLFSYTCQEWDVDPDQLTGGLSNANIVQARDCLRRYSPSLAEHCRSGRLFCDAYSASGEPLVQPLDAAGRIVFAGGANGSGYRLAPAIACEAVDLLELPSELRSAG